MFSEKNELNYKEENKQLREYIQWLENYILSDPWCMDIEKEIKLWHHELKFDKKSLD